MLDTREFSRSGLEAVIEWKENKLFASLNVECLSGLILLDFQTLSGLFGRLLRSSMSISL